MSLRPNGIASLLDLNMFHVLPIKVYNIVLIAMCTVQSTFISYKTFILVNESRLDAPSTLKKSTHSTKFNSAQLYHSPYIKTTVFSITKTKNQQSSIFRCPACAFSFSSFPICLCRFSCIIFLNFFFLILNKHFACKAL